MTHPLNRLIDARLRAADAAGEFDGLPGAGHPLPDLDQPADAVLGRMVKAAGALPPVVVFSKRVAACRERLQSLPQGADRKAEMKRLADLQTRLSIEQEAARRFG